MGWTKTTHEDTNTERRTAHTIVSWPDPKQWVIVHTLDPMMIIRQSIYVLSIITRGMGQVMKNIKECIKTPLTHRCNKSFSSGLFPFEMKIANVVTIFKSGYNMVFSSYRPVSVLPVFSKLLERLMYNRLICFINDNKLLYDYQFGFQKGKSANMAIVILIEKISETLDRGDCVIGVFLDFSKVFDTVDHKILQQQLEIYGIKTISLKWFVSYLTEWTQYVTYIQLNLPEKEFIAECLMDPYWVL